jgi:PIN domain nuclease of toxin-antitoxin system
MSMNRYLLDTHCLLWFQENNKDIPNRVMDVLKSTENEVFFSQISLFEIAIKQKIGKLPDFKVSISEIYEQAFSDLFTFLPILNQHLFQYQNIPLIESHRDPFDRLLIATAKEENLTIITADEKFSNYKELIEIYW